MYDNNRHVLGSILGGLFVVVLIVAFLAAVAFGVPAYGRYQRLANERNQTQVNDIMISQQAQLVHVHQQQAQIRIVDAGGIAQAQKIINGSLTQAYLQYEAIQAQKNEINSPNHTVIYIPSGDNGVPAVPLVQTVNPQQ